MTKPLQTPETQRMILRRAFLRAFEEEVPKALDELKGLSVEGLEGWRQRCKSSVAATIARLDALSPARLDDRLPAEWGVREARQELGALRAWARQWHIEAPWVIEHAEWTVGIWKQVPHVSLAAIWKSGAGGAAFLPPDVELVVRWSPSLPLEPVKVKHRPERFEVVVGGASRKAAWDAAREAWKAYATEVERQYKDAGFIPVKYRTGGKRNAPLDARMRWVVLRVVKGMSWAEVGGEVGLPRTTVQNPVKELIRALGLVSG